MEDEPFLTHSSLAWTDRKARKTQRALHWFWHILLSSSLIASVTYTYFSQTDTVGNCVRPKLVFAPAKGVVQYQRKTLWRNLDGNSFTGRPRPEFDKAWHDLMSPMTSRITREELDEMNEESVRLVDGSGYIAETTVYHELHCIKRIRRHLFLEHYYPNMTRFEREVEDTHMDHCLEYWRELAMCRADSSMATFHWEDGYLKSKVHSDHECVAWGPFEEWAKSRMVDLSDTKIVESG